MSIFPCSEVETDPAQLAWKMVESLKKSGAPETEIQAAYEVFEREVEKQMEQKARGKTTE